MPPPKQRYRQGSETAAIPQGCQREAEWLAALRALVDEETLRRRVGDAGRARVQESYSVAATTPRWEHALREAAALTRAEVAGAEGEREDLVCRAR